MRFGPPTILYILILVTSISAWESTVAGEPSTFANRWKRFSDWGRAPGVVPRTTAPEVHAKIGRRLVFNEK